MSIIVREGIIVQCTEDREVSVTLYNIHACTLLPKS